MDRDPSHQEVASWLRDDFEENFLGRRSRRGGRNKKTAQLCAQAQRALGTALDTELNDPGLPDLFLAEVRPYPDASRLLAVVMAPPGTDLGNVHERLRGATGHLRSILAGAISRKRVPGLSFLVVPYSDRPLKDGEVDDDWL